MFATDDICTHEFALLSEGWIDGGTIECPLHGGTFEIRTGKAVAPPCTVDLKTYLVRRDGSVILIGVPAELIRGATRGVRWHSAVLHAWLAMRTFR